MPVDGTDTSSVTIVVVARLAYRKGIDLLIATAPRICALFPNVRFLIGEGVRVRMRKPCPLTDLAGGDGPKMIDLLQMREKYLLQDRIEILGPVRSNEVQNVSESMLLVAFGHILTHQQVLNQGSIFMNTSLTESFGIATLEAACTGLYVVSTRVGGVPEILPEDLISFANPDEDGECTPCLFSLLLTFVVRCCKSHVRSDSNRLCREA